MARIGTLFLQIRDMFHEREMFHELVCHRRPKSAVKRMADAQRKARAGNMHRGSGCRV